MRSLIPLLASLLLLVSCDGKPLKFLEAPKNPFDFALFPSLGGTSKLFADIGDARLEFDPTTRDAITALGECVDAVTYCYEPGRKSLSSCLAETRTCTTKEPWTEEPCCPKACKDDFEKAAASGPPTDAFISVFFEKSTCFPGVRQALEAP